MKSSNRLANIAARQMATRFRDALFTACVLLATTISIASLM
jgi:hypothetical protein